MSKKPVRVAVTGAAGQIGYALPAIRRVPFSSICCGGSQLPFLGSRFRFAASATSD